ncbi:MAG: hypothetical protein IPQ07_14260 [Myxococcales bacterium]|nr:hypothetical protein [Myxococcales bacterium]
MSGDALHQLLGEIQRVLPFTDVLVSAASGAGVGLQGVPLLDFHGASRFSYQELLGWIPLVTQFDWGDFFLTDDPSVGALVGYTMEQLFAAAKAALVTVRALDSSEWDVLSMHPDVIRAAHERFGGRMDQAAELEAFTHLTG